MTRTLPCYNRTELTYELDKNSFVFHVKDVDGTVYTITLEDIIADYFRKLHNCNLAQDEMLLEMVEVERDPYFILKSCMLNFMDFKDDKKQKIAVSKLSKEVRKQEK